MLRRSTALGVILAAAVLSSGLAAAPMAAAEDPVYHLPAPAGATLSVRQGQGAGPGRLPEERHAFDFVTDGAERFEVVAARGGTVLSSRAGVVGGRCEEPLDGPPPDCWRNVNYLLIDHGDGTSALYTHLQRGSFRVRIGEVVAAGQPLGDAGRSGWTDHIGLGFQVQATPTWDVRGQGGWFLAESVPVSFADPDVLEQRPSGVPQTDDAVVSANEGPTFEPFRPRPRPPALPASVPFEDGVSRDLSAAYDANSPDGYGLHFAPGPVSTSVRPLFGGQLVFAGCAAGASNPLGRTVAIRFELGETAYVAIHAHLSSIAPALTDDERPPASVGPGDAIGSHGPVDGPGAGFEDDCPAAGPNATDLFVAILREGEITAEGEIVAGTPVSPEPLVGARAYEGFAWWRGPVVGTVVADQDGTPRSRWNETTPASGAHIAFGRPITLKARVRDAADIDQVRFRAWYPRWPEVEPSRGLTSFDPDVAWREIAVCEGPASAPRGYGSLCQWDGDANDAKVTYVWDPTAAKPQPSAPWLPPARAASSRAQGACVPVSLAIEVIDRAGRVRSDVASLPRPAGCDDEAAEAVEGARVLYLDPLVPPRAPASRGTSDRGWPPVYAPDPLKGAIVWRDRAGNEDGFRIYARRHWFRADCSVARGAWVLVDEVRRNRERYRPSHARVQESLPVPAEASEAPGWMAYWEYAVTAYNAAGESKKVPVGGFVGGSEAFCDPGIGPPPELEG